MYKAIVTGLIGALALAVLSFASSGSHDRPAEDRGPSKAPAHVHGSNPLIEEMEKLDRVFRDVVSAVALGNGRQVHEVLEKMHGTMEKTHEGVHHGSVTLKRNADRLNDFFAQDKQFHARLEDLAKAAHKKDQQAMLSLTKDLLDRCVKCHQEFRER